MYAEPTFENSSRANNSDKATSSVFGEISGSFLRGIIWNLIYSHCNLIYRTYVSVSKPLQ